MCILLCSVGGVGGMGGTGGYCVWESEKEGWSKEREGKNTKEGGVIDGAKSWKKWRRMD